MKKKHLNFLLYFLLIYQIGISQTEITTENQDNNILSDLTLGVLIFSYYPIATGDNFINTTYERKIGFGMDLRIGVKNFIGLGFSYSTNKADIKNTLFIGEDFTDSQFSKRVVYGYYQKLIFNNFIGEAKIGFGDIKLKNTANPGDFNIDYNTILFGINLNYAITENKNIRILLGPDFHFLNSRKLEVNTIDSSFFKKTTLIDFNLGIAIYL